MRAYSKKRFFPNTGSEYRLSEKSQIGVVGSRVETVERMHHGQ